MIKGESLFSSLLWAWDSFPLLNQMGACFSPHIPEALHVVPPPAPWSRPRRHQARALGPEPQPSVLPLLLGAGVSHVAIALEIGKRTPLWRHPSQLSRCGDPLPDFSRALRSTPGPLPSCPSAPTGLPRWACCCPQSGSPRKLTHGTTEMLS